MESDKLNLKYPIHDILKKRWSPRAFSNRPVELYKLLSILEAGRWAPSSYNEQPWNFIVATKDNQEEYKHLLSCLNENNANWAQQASVLILSVVKLHLDRNGKVNRHAFYDLGQAIANMTIQATSLDIYAHQMGGFNVEKAREIFNIPENYEPVSVIALGYLPKQMQRPLLRSRKPLEEFVFSNRWGQASPLLTTVLD